MVCPGGNVGCGDNFDWKGDGERKAVHLDAASEEVRASWPELVAAPGEDVLVGFSRGAFVARDVAYARPGRYKGLVLIGAALMPDPKRLLASGVRRVVLASGDYDGARSTMIRAAAKLKLGGVDTRFVSTGRIHHQLPHDLAKILAPHIAWVRASTAAEDKMTRARDDAPGSQSS
jgi:predicted esterase